MFVKIGYPVSDDVIVMIIVGSILVLFAVPTLFSTFWYLLLWQRLKKEYPEAKVPFEMPVWSGKYRDQFPFTEGHVRKELRSLRWFSLLTVPNILFWCILLSVIIPQQ